MVMAGSHCTGEILGLNFLPEEMVGSHSFNRLQCCALNHRVSELEENTYNENNNFYLFLKTCPKIADYTRQAKKAIFIFHVP